MDIRCADCGGNVWRSVTMHRPGHEGRMVTTHTFTCDTCVEKRDGRQDAEFFYHLSPQALRTCISGLQADRNILVQQIDALRSASASLNDDLAAERADHEATKKWLRRARDLLDGLVK